VRSNRYEFTSPNNCGNTPQQCELGSELTFQDLMGNIAYMIDFMKLIEFEDDL